MDKQAKICVLGAGAIGCTVAARLILAGFEHVALVARGQNRTVLMEHGIHLTDLTGEHHVYPDMVVEDISSLPAQDVVFIATKADALKNVVDGLNTVLHESSLVIPLMNGIPFWYFYIGQERQEIQSIQCLDQDEMLIQKFPFQQLIGSVVFITAELLSHGVVKSNNPYLLIFGEPEHQKTPRIEALAALFADTSIEARVVDNIRDQIWTKVIANLSSNPLSVVTGATLQDIYSHPKLHTLVTQIMQEIRLVAVSYGARISIDPHSFLKLGAQMGDVHTSMWQDYQHKRPLELNSIAMAVFELAERYECQMPITQNICSLTQYLSEQSRTTTAC
ncbi:ketopantoate reductase family protein [Acinetobacter sp. MB5]|uniref:ketopantoate reductase family protein n=1 Tax=Acinetobacter sp. MB5 TaxID=2069438 RepID=UPI000DD0187D|nr:2-dehydropantoate 2-reductase [Acinetobacter sp. MB5]